MSANDWLRGLIRAGLPLAAWWARRRLSSRIATFDPDQAALRKAYGITPDTPVVGYDAGTRKRIEGLARARPEVRLATTSGSTGAPKALAYPPERLDAFREDSGAMGVVAFHTLRLRGASFFVLGSLTPDTSFATLVLHQGEPGWVQGLIEPARYLSTPAMAEALEEYGATAARLWLMLLADPGMIYSTNPSTLAVFLGELHDDWDRVVGLTRAWVRGDLSEDRGLARVARRVSGAGATERLRRAAAATEPPAMEQLLPGLGAYCCWDGGYVTAFLRQIHRWMPPDRFVHVPMYAMSTETIETIAWFEDKTPHFLPLGPGVLYEFLPEGADDDPALLLRPDALEPEHLYTLVVSDPYGLRRYQTEDLFACVGRVRGLPDLRFARRRGLAWSFTGEKLTGEQLVVAFARLEQQYPALAALAAQMTVLPSWPEGQALPCYRLVIAPPGKEMPALDLAAIAVALDRVLAERNEEYAGKRGSDRLGPPSAHLLPYDTIAAALDSLRLGKDDAGGRSWESQFKLMPLTRVSWEEAGLGDA